MYNRSKKTPMNIGSALMRHGAQQVCEAFLLYYKGKSFGGRELTCSYRKYSWNAICLELNLVSMNSVMNNFIMVSNMQEATEVLLNLKCLQPTYFLHWFMFFTNIFVVFCSVCGLFLYLCILLRYMSRLFVSWLMKMLWYIFISNSFTFLSSINDLLIYESTD